MCEVQTRLAQVESDRGELRASATQIRERNRSLKREYDTLLEQRSDKEKEYRQAREMGQEMVEDMIKNKQDAAMKMNNRNEKRVRYRPTLIRGRPVYYFCLFRCLMVLCMFVSFLCVANVYMLQTLLLFAHSFE